MSTEGASLLRTGTAAVVEGILPAMVIENQLSNLFHNVSAPLDTPTWVVLSVLLARGVANVGKGTMIALGRADSYYRFSDTVGRVKVLGPILPMSPRDFRVNIQK